MGLRGNGNVGLTEEQNKYIRTKKCMYEITKHGSTKEWKHEGMETWEWTHCDLMVNAALVMEAGRFNSFATALHAFFLITCKHRHTHTSPVNFRTLLF